jgi:hypothetical protein
MGGIWLVGLLAREASTVATDLATEVTTFLRLR